MANGCYVYAITPRDPPLLSRIAGMDGASLVSFPWRDLSLVSSYVDSVRFEPTPEHLLRHEEVVEAIRMNGPALPVRFGTVLPSWDALVEAVSGRYESLLADLERLGDKSELGLVVLWAAESADEETDGHRGAASRNTCAQTGDGARYLMAKLAERRKEEALRGKAAALAGSIDSFLRAYVMESRFTVMPTPRLVVKATYLLAPPQLSEFYEAFDELRIAFHGLRFLLNGPWPPYSFVTPSSTPPRGASEGARSPLPAVTAPQLLESVIGALGGDKDLRDRRRTEQSS